MQQEDFYKLTIGQKIWHNGEQRAIDSLDGSGDFITFKETGYNVFDWRSICQDCSLTAPKKKVKKVVEGWVNIYKDSFSNSYDTIKMADRGQRGNRITCKKVTIEYEVEE